MLFLLSSVSIKQIMIAESKPHAGSFLYFHIIKIFVESGLLR